MDTYRVGEVTIRRIVEREGPAMPPQALLKTFDPAVLEQHRSWLMPGFYDPEKKLFVSSVHAWLLRTRHHTILIDTCIGNHKERPTFPRMHRLETMWLENLAAAGARPDQVDIVMCTHLHADHCGWNTRLENGRWVPTFPKARYVFSRKEAEWADYRGKGDDGRHAHDRAAFDDSILPILEARKAVLVDDGYAVDDNLIVEPANGHTPGSVVLRLKGSDGKGLFTGDMMHHPIQVYRPDWSSNFCSDPVASARTRRRVLEENADRDVRFFPAHFAAPYVGRVVGNAAGFAFRFV
jgi:glyoxylase-like metal-dependent hydrolase (beta-lactamase superfamily II)